MKTTLNSSPVWKQHLFSLLIAILFMSCATAASFLYHYIIPENTSNIALLYILAIILIGRYTIGYWYGIICTIMAVLLINFVFTYPFFELNFTLSGYPFTFLIMLGVSLIISTMTSHLTLQNELIAERERQLAEAETEKMRANLLRAISHDLRTPLTGIIGNSTLFLDRQTVLSPEDQRDILTNIYNDSNWLLNMVENLLTVTRMQGNNFNITTKDEAIEEVLGEALQKLHKRYPDEVIQVHLPDEFILLPMDAILIEQVTVNLLENAIVHADSPKPIDIFVENHIDHISVTIRDYGVGIPTNMQEHLFDNSIHIVSQISDKRKGMGIGLSICNTIIAAHHGTLIGRNHSDGAEFIFTLPKKK